MSIRYWQVLVVMGCLSVLSLTSSFAVAQNDEPVSEKLAPESNLLQLPNLIIDPSVLRGMLIDIPEIPPERKADERKDQREESDLAAQWEMAYWAERMFWATALQALLAAISLGLIWRTLHWTRKAVRKASIANRAAQAAVKVTKDAADSQLRAYVNMRIAKDIRIFDRERAQVTMTFHNYGQTPAKNMVVRQCCFVGPVPLTDTPPTYDRQSESVVLPPTGDFFWRSKTPEDKKLVDGDREAIRRGDKGFYVKGRVEYFDGFHAEPRVTEYLYVATHSTDELREYGPQTAT